MNSSLVMLSGIDEHLDQELEQRIRQIVSGRGRMLGYIPSQYDETHDYFNRMKPYFERFGFKNYRYADIDKEYDESKVNDLWNCDVIYLSGGNTYYFLKNLRERGLLSFLCDFVKKDGTLIGVSAGSMMMSPTIEIASFLDPNEVGLSDLDALDLAPFHFLPHFNDRISFTKSVEEFCRKSGIPVYVCDDGAGIVFEYGNVECYGNVSRVDLSIKQN